MSRRSRQPSRSSRCSSIAPLILGIAVVCLGGTTLARPSASGKPSLKADDPPGIHIWHAEDGWHVRTTVARKQHTFRGRIRGDNLAVTKHTRKILETKVSLAPKRTQIDFEFDSFKGIDGFDFTADSECLTFELRIDKKPDDQKVHLGAKGASPAAIPFDACR